MNNPLCQETQTALLTRQEAGAALPPQAADHLKECQECREFQETLSLLLPLPLLFGFPSVSPSSFFCCSLQILIFLDFYSLALNLSSTAFIP